MKVILLIALLCLSAVTASKVETTSPGLDDILAEGSPIRTLIDGVLDNGSSSELSTYIGLFNQFYPVLKTLADSVDPEKGEMLKQFDYRYCINDNFNKPVICFDAVWTFIIGFHSEQFADENRFYNLTISPYATMHADFSVSTFTGPARVLLGQNFEFVHFRAPFSFEVETRDKLCYAGDLHIKPINTVTAVRAQFLECELTIPEETHRCSWDEGVGALIQEHVLTEGYESTLLDRVCITSS